MRRGCRRAAGRAARASNIIAATCLEDGVSHAAGLLVENDVLDHADFRAVGGADLRADDLAARQIFRGGRRRRG